MLRRSIPVLVLAVTVLSVFTSEAFADRAARQARRASRGGRFFTSRQQSVTPTTAQPTVGQPSPNQPMPMPTTQQSGYRSYYRVPTPDAPAGTVLLNVQVPANAKVWIDGASTTSTGVSRSFVSPPLTAGQFTYTVKAQWTEGGQQVTRTRRIPVQAGQAVDINLLQPTQEEMKSPRKTEDSE